jgi:hypothetical protein
MNRCLNSALPHKRRPMQPVFAFAVVGESVEVVNSSAYLHDEAAILDAEELCDARAALIEDGIFASDGLDRHVRSPMDGSRMRLCELR